MKMGGETWKGNVKEMGTNMEIVPLMGIVLGLWPPV